MNIQWVYPFFSNVTSPTAQKWPSLSSSWPCCLLLIIFTYLFLCWALRFRRINALQAKYRYGTPATPSYGGMTVNEAHDIGRVMHESEFPALSTIGLHFALFRPYGIPTISDLAVKTAQLSTAKNVPRRYADTTVLLSDLYGAEPTSDRCIAAYVRLNYLHGHYIKEGKISNNDMLYTLALLLGQPVEWINRYEWRQLTDLEICAMAVVHKAMGEDMNISFEVLPSYSTGWKDGLHFCRELDAWAREYERVHMVPNRNNYDTAVATVQLILSTYPTFMRGVITKVLSSFLDERLRKAIMFDEAPPLYTSLLNGFMRLRRLYLRYLALPRLGSRRAQFMTTQPDEKGWRYILWWDTTPIYVKPTVWNRWGPGALVNVLLGVPRPGDEGMCPEGFQVKDVGPTVFVGKGAKEMDVARENLRENRTGGCPFAIRR